MANTSLDITMEIILRKLYEYKTNSSLDIHGELAKSRIIQAMHAAFLYGRDIDTMKTKHKH